MYAPDARLPSGTFFGCPCASRAIPGVVVVESDFTTSRTVPAHEHATAFFDYVADGGYAELIERRPRERERFSLGFHPAGERHSSKWLGRAARCLHIEIAAPLIERVGRLDRRRIARTMGRTDRSRP